jgi:hypothetical protein
MTYDQMMERLRWMSNANPGDMPPEWVSGNWSNAIAEVAMKALDVIEKPTHKLSCGCCTCGEVRCAAHASSDRAKQMIAEYEDRCREAGIEP